MGRPDVSRNLVAEFIPDPASNDAVFIKAQSAEPGTLVLEVRLPAGQVGAWGIALHLAYDRNLLRLLDVEPALNLQFQAAEIAPGRLALGRLMPPDEDLVAVLRFALAGRGEGRLDLPPRHRSLRSSDNQPREVRWTGGSIRVVER